MHKRRLIQFALAGLAGLTIHPLAAAAASQTADEDLPLLVAGMDAAYPPFGFKDSKDLEGKRLAVTIGSTGEIAAKRIPHAQVRVFNTLSDCFLELINNGVDAVLNDIPTNDYYAVTAGAGKVDSLSISLAAEDLGIAVKKGRKDLLEKINKGLASLKASGEFSAIYKKWFGREPSPELLR